MKNTKLITMIEGAIIAGVCVALSYIPLNTANASFDLSLGLVPLGVYALRRGLAPGMSVGFVWGLLMIMLGKAWILSPLQAILEYPIAFAFGGFGGIFAGRLKRGLAAGFTASNVSNTGDAKKIGIGILLTVVFAGIVAALTRWVFHFCAGLIFWLDYLPDSVNLILFEFTVTPYQFNFIANGASAAANAVMLAVILSILIKTARTIFTVKA